MLTIVKVIELFSRSAQLGMKGALTIWPAYAYTLAAQNTVIKLPMVILYVEDNTSMSCEDIHATLFLSIIWLKSKFILSIIWLKSKFILSIIWLKSKFQWRWGSKFHKIKAWKL